MVCVSDQIPFEYMKKNDWNRIRERKEHRRNKSVSRPSEEKLQSLERKRDLHRVAIASRHRGADETSRNVGPSVQRASVEGQAATGTIRLMRVGANAVLVAATQAIPAKVKE